MIKHNYLLNLEADSERASDTQARAFTDSLREIEGVEKAERLKENKNTMDLGTIITVLASSGATLALSQGIADWLRSRRSTKLTIERDASTDSIKATVEGIDPDTAQQIVELIRGQ
ncbi:hypothetical protein PQR21_14910 [Paraburkholderia nemoris]|uniref:effector-associated constant component EACC1 n=1 Tax=Paraburkholderia nemoris TaxID=2793076 RepID=UPI0038B93895